MIRIKPTILIFSLIVTFGAGLMISFGFYYVLISLFIAFALMSLNFDNIPKREHFYKRVYLGDTREIIEDTRINNDGIIDWSLHNCIGSLGKPGQIDTREGWFEGHRSFTITNFKIRRGKIYGDIEFYPDSLSVIVENLFETNKTEFKFKFDSYKGFIDDISGIEMIVK